MSADVKANIKQLEIKDLVAYLTNIYKSYLKNLKYNIKIGCIFHSVLLDIPFILIFSIKSRVGEGRGVSLNGQNLLSVSKVICRHSLTS